MAVGIVKKTLHIINSINSLPQFYRMLVFGVMFEMPLKDVQSDHTT